MRTEGFFVLLLPMLIQNVGWVLRNNSRHLESRFYCATEVNISLCGLMQNACIHFEFHIRSYLNAWVEYYDGGRHFDASCRQTWAASKWRSRTLASGSRCARIEIGCSLFELGCWACRPRRLPLQPGSLKLVVIWDSNLRKKSLQCRILWKIP